MAAYERTAVALTSTIAKSRPRLDDVRGGNLPALSRIRGLDSPSVRQPLARTFTLQRALLAAVSIAILAGMVPAGLVLDRRLAAALDERSRADLALAPRVLADRRLANADAMMMHAKDFSHVAGLADALARNDRDGTLAVVEATRATLGNVALVIGPDGRSWTGPSLDSALVAQTRLGKMPVTVRRDGHAIQNVALAPVIQNGRWVGAVGLVAPVDANAAGVLSGLTRSDVVIVDAEDGMVAATTLDSLATRELVAAERGWLHSTASREVTAGGLTRLVIAAPLGDEGIVLFTRALNDEFAVLPDLRRVAFVSALAALVLALALGAFMATRVARPVRQLADAAAALATGEFGAPLPNSRIREVERVANTFDTMRRALAARLDELRNANEALSDRNARLTALQADLMQRDRLAATGRLVTQLAHEIRNPVANLRNCLELIRRRVDHDAEAREFTDLAIDELLRMHELAEQMLDVNRPREPGALRCVPEQVAREVATLSSLGRAAVPVLVTAHGANEAIAALAPDALKQVLLNLVQNARDAFPDVTSVDVGHEAQIEIIIDVAEHEVHVIVQDNGPGIATQILPRIFDPFFTTKGAVHGVGLGLFVAEGLVRTAGGRLFAGNRDAGGAWFRLDLPRVHDMHGADTASHEPANDHGAVRAVGLAG